MADSIAASRVRREINEFQKKADCAGIVLELEDNDLMKLSGSIQGPPDTSYAGGTYKLAIGKFLIDLDTYEMKLTWSIKTTHFFRDSANLPIQPAQSSFYNLFVASEYFVTNWRNLSWYT